MTVAKAVQNDLKELRERAPDLAGSSLAASALVLARELDNRRNSATSKSMCARELREVMGRLWELAPAPEEADWLDELKERRDTRRGAAAAAVVGS